VSSSSTHVAFGSQCGSSGGQSTSPAKGDGVRNARFVETRRRAGVFQVALPERQGQQLVRGPGAPLAVVAVGHPRERVAHGEAPEVRRAALHELQGQRRQVVAAVGLGREVERPARKVREALAPARDEVRVVPRDHAVVVVVHGARREADARGLLDEEHVRELVPRVVAAAERPVRVGHEGAHLADEAAEAAAAGPAVGPEQHGRRRRVDFGLDEPEKELARAVAVVRDVDVAAVHLERDAARDAG